ncbi:MAG: endolytic transglycosylase MltG, partial [Anaerovorax sp.]
RVILIIAIVILILFMAVNFYLGNGSKPVDPNNTASVSIVVTPGSGTGSIGALLKENKLIDNVVVFKLQSKLAGNDGKYKAGSFLLSPSMSMKEMMAVIIAGNSDTKRFTIPEGYDIKRTMEKLSKEGLINRDVFAREIEYGVFDYEFLKDAPPGPHRLEGYLYPETYDIFSDASERDIINKMLSQFDKVFTKQYAADAKALGMDFNQVLTMASLIERETRVDDEKELVASVINNRIAAGMPLQIDATVQYALGEQKERLLYEDLKIDSPYNTYKIKGLPPGPICSPSIESIYAVLHPADTKYLYYVLKPSMDGSHAFSSNYNQFLKDKDAYIKNAFGE